MDRLSNIIAFVTVAEAGSFVEAARRLNIANSVVSKRIRDLEDDLGVRLLQRSTRRVGLTDAGYQYFDQTRRILGELAEVEENIRYRNENPVGELRVSAPVSFGVQFMGPAIAGYLARYPDVAVKLHLTDLTVDIKGEGYDLAIGIGGIGDGNMIARKIAASRRVVVASPAYLAAHGAPQTPQELARHNCLAYSHLEDGRHWPFIVNGKKYLQHVQGRFAANNGMILREAAVDGCGLAMLPSFLVAADIAAGRLALVLEAYEDEPMKIEAAYTRQRIMSARTRTFIDYMAEYFSGGSVG